jgi:citrate lyase subunit beta/citryl-CoA lyase
MSTAAAGRRGDRVRSDIWVSLELRNEGALEIDCFSRAGDAACDSIRAQIPALLEALGVRHARIEIEDAGALPFAIAARLEAAALRAGVTPARDSRPPHSAPLVRATAKDSLRRSRLYIPGNNPAYFVSAGLHEPDGIILDLEDSVHADDKDCARLLVRNALRTIDFKGAERMVRINRLPLGFEDLEVVIPEQPDMILISKTEAPEEVVAVADAIDRIQGGEAGERPLWLMPILESALGVEHAFAIASASKRVAAITLGLEDYAADLGVPRSADGVESIWARSRVVNAARAAGVQAIDSVYGQIDDLEGLRAWSEGAHRLGFQGMGCIHPRQIEVIHEGFRPSSQAIARARRIVEAYEKAEAEGSSVVALGSKMIDPPVVKQALRLIRQAEEWEGDGD